jgi:hypothetical protein
MKSIFITLCVASGLTGGAALQCSADELPNGPLAPQMRAALDLQSGALTLNFLISDYRIERETRAALERVLPGVRARLAETGAVGALYQARYERQKGAETFAEDMPVNTTEHLIGNELHPVGVGRSPTAVLAMSFDQTQFSAGPKTGFEAIPLRTRSYWITRGADGDLLITEPDHAILTHDARQLFFDKSRLAQLKTTANSDAVGHAIAAFEKTASGSSLAVEAAALRAAREHALEELHGIDQELSEELDRARSANAAADVFAITQTLGGLGSTILASPSGNSGNASSQATVPSAAVRPLIERKVLSDDKLLKTDRQLRGFLQKNRIPLDGPHL